MVNLVGITNQSVNDLRQHVFTLL